MNEDSVHRLGIFLCFDPEGIIDDYIPYQLNDLKENLERLVVVVNGLLTSEGKKKLEAITEDVIVRSNDGLDFGAWKYVLREYLNWETLMSFDELVLMNDSCFGPIYPFSEVFRRMGGHADFWGLTMHVEDRNSNPFNRCPYGYMPEHLQSYFLVICSRMLHSPEFESYWANLIPGRNYKEAVAKCECVFTKHFSDLGYSYAALVDTRDMEKPTPTEYSFFLPKELFLRGMPLLKKKAFTYDLDDLLQIHIADDVNAAMTYIREQTSYDESLIWQNILRRYNISDIHNTMHLDYVLSAKVIEVQEKAPRKAIVVIHQYYMDLVEDTKRYIASIPSDMDVLITTCSEENRGIIQNAYEPILEQRLKVLVVKNRGRDVAAFLIVAKPYLKSYEYICFCHDKKVPQAMYTIGNSYRKLSWENMLSSVAYIENIMSKFAEEPHLGVLVPPRFFGGEYMYKFDSGLWAENYKGVTSLAKRLGIKTDMDPNKDILCMGFNFWARTKALEPLLRYPWTYEDFPEEPLPEDGGIHQCIERILQFVAQHEGYYTGIVMTPEYAAIQTSAFFHVAKRRAQIGVFSGPLSMRTAFTFIKQLLKRKLPRSVWNRMKRVYHKLRAK